jgi:hypothetical protein
MHKFIVSTVFFFVLSVCCPLCTFKVVKYRLDKCCISKMCIYSDANMTTGFNVRSIVDYLKGTGPLR